MYLSVYLFKSKPAGLLEVDFVVGNGRDQLQNLMPQKEEGVIREGEDFHGGGLIREGDSPSNLHPQGSGQACSDDVDLAF